MPAAEPCTRCPGIDPLELIMVACHAKPMDHDAQPILATRTALAAGLAVCTVAAPSGASASDLWSADICLSRSERRAITAPTFQAVAKEARWPAAW